jgi:hypothetical protein
MTRRKAGPPHSRSNAEDDGRAHGVFGPVAIGNLNEKCLRLTKMLQEGVWKYRLIFPHMKDVHRLRIIKIEYKVTFSSRSKC